MRNLSLVRASTDVSQIAGDLLPLRAVGSCGARERVGDLMQQHLVDLVVLEFLGKILRDGDPALRVIAQARPALRIVEAKAPSSLAEARVEVVPDQGLSPAPHPVQLAHG